MKLLVAQPANEIIATLPQTIPATAPPEMSDPASSVVTVVIVAMHFLSVPSS